MNIAIFDPTFVGPIANGVARIGHYGGMSHPFSRQPMIGSGGARYFVTRFSCSCPCANRGGMDGANNKSHSHRLGDPQFATCKG